MAKRTTTKKKKSAPNLDRAARELANAIVALIDDAAPPRRAPAGKRRR